MLQNRVCTYYYFRAHSYILVVQSGYTLLFFYSYIIVVQIKPTPLAGDGAGGVIYRVYVTIFILVHNPVSYTHLTLPTKA